MTTAERRLEAPHRRRDAPPRIVEKGAVLAYRGAARVLGALPAEPSRAVAGRLAQASYHLWPMKRRWSNRNFAHVLGLSPDDPEVRRTSLAAYRQYGRYLVDLMRLPSQRQADLVDLVEPLDVADIERIRASSPAGIILAAAHIGHNEAVCASVADLGLPITVVADDTSFPELFELLSRQRIGWGVNVVPWRNLRSIYQVLKRREFLALLTDWGYKADGVPVRLFGAWTALPAGPAYLAAKTGSLIVPLSIAREANGRFRVIWLDPIAVESTDPATLQAATQRVADALARAIARAPVQWYSFKPLWPAGDEEATDLERRARLMLAGTPDPGPGRAGRPPAGDRGVVSEPG
ncbi:MAG: lysophospholipid acyltransferase family protein [Chloroflexota bacterium]